jgi:hypothetical protein
MIIPFTGIFYHNDDTGPADWPYLQPTGFYEAEKPRDFIPGAFVSKILLA